MIGCFLFIDCLKEEKTDVTNSLNSIYNNNLGKKGTILIKSSYYPSFTFFDTSKSILFKSKLKNNEKEYQVDCGFWRAESEKGSRLYTFCNYDEKIPAVSYDLDITGVSPISITNYTITLEARDVLHFTKSDINIIDIYSDKQTINVVEGKDDYELRFKISSYNQEHNMIIGNLYIFIDCSQQNNELVCPLTKSFLESISVRNEEKIYIGTRDYIIDGEPFPLIPEIVIKFDIKKTDVFVGITKLIESVSEKDTFAAYETNITDINNVSSSVGNLKLKFTDGTITKNSECFFSENIMNILY